MRLFTAVDIPDVLRDELVSIQEQHALSVRWTDPEQFHVTIRFIGEVDEDQAARYNQALADVDVPPVRCVPYGMDVLPSRNSPRVVILGLERTESMKALYRAVSEALEAEGLESETRTYRPHVTIARVDNADPEAIHSVLRAHDDRSFPSFHVDHFVLYESILTPEGATHEIHAQHALNE